MARHHQQRKSRRDRSRFQTALAKVLLTLLLLLTTKPQGAPVSITYSQISGLSGAMAEVAQTVTVRAYGTDNVARTYGGENFYILIEQYCTISSNICCSLSGSQDNVPGLPIEVQMSDHGDGYYSHTFTITGGGGTTSVSVTTAVEGGAFAEYYTNTSRSGTPYTCYIEGMVYKSWGSGIVSPTNQYDSVSARWTGWIYVPTSETYTFRVYHDDHFTLSVGGCSMSHAGSGDWDYMACYLTAGSLNTYELTWYEGSGSAYLYFQWYRPSRGYYEWVDNASFWSLQRVGNAVHTLEIALTSVPNQCTIESKPTTHTAGTTYTMTLQSRNSQGTAHSVSADTYTVTFACSSNCGSESFSTTATHQGYGLYQAQFTPTDDGTYTVSATMTNAYTATDGNISTTVSGSSYSVTVYPGTVDPVLCYTDVPVPTTESQTADVAYTFNIQFVDLWGNLHYLSMQDELDDGMTVTVTATYDNHDNWSSYIGITDDPDWQTTYGTTLTGSATDSNDGTMAATVTVQRAGSYSLTVQVDGYDVVDSPFFVLEIEPTTLDAPTCVVQDVPAGMYAGYEYSFLVQGRDIFVNNMHTRLNAAVGSDKSVALTLFEGFDTFNGKIIDSSSYTYNNLLGIYQVYMDVPKTQAAGLYDLTVLLLGEQVSTPLTIVLPCLNSVGLDRGILSAVGNTYNLETLKYTVAEASQTTYLPSVIIHCEHVPIQILELAQVTKQGGTPKEVDQTQLELYGILLQLTGTSPSVTVFTEQEQYSGYTFYLQFKSTVEEELTWADFSVIEIEYAQAEQTLIEVTEADLSPGFNPDSTSSATLQMELNQGNQVLSALDLDCTVAWSKILPEIIDENSEKVQIEVNLDTAKSFLSYDPSKRKLTLIPQPDGLTYDSYSMKIKITDLKGYQSTYRVQIAIQCPLQWAEELPETSYELRFDENPPVPFVDTMTSDGIVKIQFNSTMQLEDSLLNQTSPADRRLLAKSSSEDKSMVNGHAKSTSSNFAALHNSTVRINGTELESMSVRVEPADPDTLSVCANHLDFDWEVIDYAPSGLTLKLDFSTPECVSSQTSQGDFLVITLNDQRLFEDSNGKVIWPQTEIRVRIKRQKNLSNQQDDIHQALLSYTEYFIFVTSILAVLASLIAKDASNLLRLSTAFKRLQIIVFTLLIKVKLAAHTEEFLQSLQSLISLKFLDKLHDFESISQKMLAVEKVEPIDVHFASIGFETSDAILNMSSFIAVAVIVAILLNILLILQMLDTAEKDPVVVYFKDFSISSIFGGVIDWCSTYLALCCVISVYQRHRDVEVSILSYRLAVGVLILVPFYLVFLFLILSGLQLASFWSRCKQRKEKKPKISLRKRIKAEAKKETGVSDRAVLALHVLSVGRRVALAVVLTYGRSSLASQLIFVNFCSLLIIAAIGLASPFKTRADNRMELWNEFSVLLLCSNCLVQTDFVDDLEIKGWAAWSLNGLVAFTVLINFGQVFYESACTVCAWIRRQVRISQLRDKIIENENDKLREMKKEISMLEESERKKITAPMHVISERSSSSEESDSDSDSDSSQVDKVTQRVENETQRIDNPSDPLKVFDNLMNGEKARQTAQEQLSDWNKFQRMADTASVMVPSEVPASEKQKSELLIDDESDQSPKNEVAEDKTGIDALIADLEDTLGVIGKNDDAKTVFSQNTVSQQIVPDDVEQLSNTRRSQLNKTRNTQLAATGTSLKGGEEGEGASKRILPNRTNDLSRARRFISKVSTALEMQDDEDIGY